MGCMNSLGQAALLGSIGNIKSTATLRVLLRILS